MRIESMRDMVREDGPSFKQKEREKEREKYSAENEFLCFNILVLFAFLKKPTSQITLDCVAIYLVRILSPRLFASQFQLKNKTYIMYLLLQAKLMESNPWLAPSTSASLAGNRHATQPSKRIYTISIFFTPYIFHYRSCCAEN